MVYGKLHGMLRWIYIELLIKPFVIHNEGVKRGFNFLFTVDLLKF